MPLGRTVWVLGTLQDPPFPWDLATVWGDQSAFTGELNYLLPQVGKIIIIKKVPSTRS